MLNRVTYRKFVSLGNGTRIMLRFLNEGDRESFVQLFQEASEADIQFWKQDFKNAKTINDWLDNINYRRILPLVGVDLKAHRLVANANLELGKYTARHIGEVRLFLSEPYRGLGLGGIMLDEIIDLASREDLHLLKAEVIIENRKAINAFRAKGFEIKAILEDYFLRKDEVTHDVVLMVRRLQNGEERAEF
jgi:RimJ/RimL family protein N-acetyltransferase